MNGVNTEVPFNVYDKGFVGNYFKTFIKPLFDMGVDFFSLDKKSKDIYSLRMTNYYFYNYMNAEPDKRGMIVTLHLLEFHIF